MRRTCLHILQLGILYFVFARLVHFLAIPPGYAVAIWPSAGIALAYLLLFGYRTWPGAFIGQMGINLWVAWDGQADTILASLPLALTVGAGAAAGAVCGAALIRRSLTYPTRLENDRDIILFFVLGGPVAAMVSPTICVTGLWVNGIIDASDYLLNWSTWWVGDAIGVCLFAPLVLVLFNRDSADWRARVTTLVPSLSIMSLLVITLFVYASRHEQRRITGQFRATASELGERIEDGVRDYLDITRSIGDLYRSSDFVSPEEFKTFVGRSLDIHTGLLAVSWVPRVTHGEKSAFEDNLTADHPEVTGIMDWTEAGFVRPKPSSDYFPVRYVEPDINKKTVLGYNLLSNPTRREALDTAARMGRATATQPVKLVSGGLGFVVFEPIYLNPEKPGAVEDDPYKHIDGFAVGVFKVVDLIQESIGSDRQHGLYLSLDDITDQGRARVIYINNETPTGSDYEPWQSHFEVAGRKWQITCTPTDTYLAMNRPWAPWGVMAGGLFVTCLLSALLLITNGRTAGIKRLVDERTAELAQVNEKLREMADTAHRFVDNVAHDFRTPLTVIKAFSSILVKGLKNPDIAAQKDQLGYINRATDELAQMVDDFLDSSKLRHKALPMDRTEHSIDALFDSVRDTIQTRAINQHIQIVEQISPGLPKVYCDMTKSCRVLINLAINAIKFSPDGGRVDLWAKRDGDNVLVGVTDRGPGICENDLLMLYKRFNQLGDAQKTVEKGFGLGLSIAKELACLNLGSISIQSEPGKGSTFAFSIPVSRHDAIIRAYIESLTAIHCDNGISLLKFTCDDPKQTGESLRQFISSTTHASDLVLQMQSDSTVMLVGPSDKPMVWGGRLQARWKTLHADSCLRFVIANSWRFPDERDRLMNNLLGEGVPSRACA